MLKHILVGFGWLLVVTTSLNIGVKLFGTDDAVLRYAGSSRNLNAPFTGFAVGLVFLGISSILSKLDRLLGRDASPD